MKEYLVICLYLWLVFALLVLHTEVILAAHHIEFEAHGLALINALALGKVVLALRKLRFFDRFNDDALLYPTLLQSAAFAVVLAFFKILEEAALGVYHGETFQESIAAIGGGTWKGILTLTVLVAVLLIPFFGYSELARVLGPGKLRQIFFRPRHLRNLFQQDSNPSLNPFFPSINLNPLPKGEQK
jgi:hypothetical protein